MTDPYCSQALDETTDQLTGVLDERVLHRRLNTEIARFEDVHAPFTLLLVEVGGDDDELARRRALRAVAAALAGACRNDDPIYRNGAEGFAVLLQGSAGAATKAVKGRAEQAVHGLERKRHGVPVLANRRTGTSRWRAYVA